MRLKHEASKVNAGHGLNLKMCYNAPQYTFKLGRVISELNSSLGI